MTTQVTATNLDSNSVDNKFLDFQIQLPNQCPHCSTAYASNPRYTCFYRNAFGGVDLYSTFFCPVCEKAFFIVYNVDEFYSHNCGFIFNQYPVPTSSTSFSEELSILSPQFIEIYHQAEKAENSGLTELCGIGYRKALEFLVKDYAISSHPKCQEQIESSLLSKCITDYIDNEKIKTLAKASAWIGNDETHYVRKHQDYDVQDLKRFIKATVAYIESELSFDEAFHFLNDSQQ